MATGVAWALASPVGGAPDDNYHQTSIWCAAGDTNTCTLLRDADGTVTAVVPERVARSELCYRFQPETSAACSNAVGNRPTRYVGPPLERLYPGGYYDAMHLFVRDEIAQSVLLIRIGNVVIATALIGAVLLVAGASARTMLTLGLLAASVPLGWFVLASVNPSRGRSRG